MPKQYTKEQLEELLEKLPQELQEALFSLETAENILNSCEAYGVTDERMGQVAERVGQTLMGLLPPADLPRALQQEIGLSEILAKAITREINRFIFYPVKPLLEELYKIEIAPPAKPTEITPPPEEKSPTPPGKDVYREVAE